MPGWRAGIGLAAAAWLLLGAGLPVRAQPAEVVAHADALSLLDDPDPALAAGKRLVFDMWRSVVNAGHVERADTMLRPDYIQHSPVLPTGREAFKAIFSAIERRPVPELVSPPVVAMVAEGPLVIMALREELPDAGGGRYTTTHFNLFRVQGGQLAEHWHSVQTAPGPHVLAPDQGGPQPVIGASGADQYRLLAAADPRVAANKRLVFDAWRQVVEAGRAELADLYFASDYLDRDPNGTSGRAALKAALERAGPRPIATSIAAPIVAMVAQGDLVVLVTGREHPHPGRPGATYTTTHFDMFRIVDHRIAEHWSGEPKRGAPPGPY